MMSAEMEARLKKSTLESLRNRCAALGIDPEDIPREQMIAKIMAEEQRRSTETEAKAVRKDMAKENTSEPYKKANLDIPVARCWFRVAEGAGPMEKSPVFAGLNGDSILVKRNMWVQLRTEFLPVFTDAVVTDVEIDLEGNTHIRQVPRYNFEIRSLSEGKPKEADLPKGF